MIVDRRWHQQFLIACLPNKSKELLRKNRIYISTPTPNPPLFNYAAFCKVLSIYEIGQIIIDHVLNDRNEPSLGLGERDCLVGGNYLVADEIIQMFMNQISS